MRVLQGRGDWLPRVRIKGLRRYAFIGDSHAYGAGVAPDQTLPANAERQMNEILPAWPIEGVNLGVSGYNLWNSWLAFKRVPQVYDGLILVLCNNDAELFGRTFHFVHPRPTHQHWQSDHPLGAAVVPCFDEIVEFTQRHSLPVAVVFYNVHSAVSQLKIGEIIGQLCASRNFCFIDSFTHYRERNFAFADLVVSPADYHPSASAHEAIGRHLVATLKRQGWFSHLENSDIGAAPDRILVAAQAMIETDRYPPDAALSWALRALDSKSKVARRIAAEGETDNYGPAAARVAETLTTANRCWHTIHRTRGFFGDIATNRLGIGWHLFRLQEERLQLEELGFALETGNWSELKVYLPESALPPEGTSYTLPTQTDAFFNECIRKLLALPDSFDKLRSQIVPTVFSSAHDQALMLADVENLFRLADRAVAECAELKDMFSRILGIFARIRPTLSEDQVNRLSRIVGASFKNVERALSFILRIGETVDSFSNTKDVPYTTVEVTIRADAMEGKLMCTLAGQIEYSVPHRLPFNVAGTFNLGPTPTLIKIYFPFFYAGRLILSPRIPKTLESVEATLVKVEIYNAPKERRIIEPEWFRKDSSAQFISPPIYLY